MVNLGKFAKGKLLVSDHTKSSYLKKYILLSIQIMSYELTFSMIIYFISLLVLKSRLLSNA